MMNISNADRAHVLVEALPYIKKYTDKIIVIKYGGSSMIDDSLKEAVMRDVALLNLIGVKVVLVHGGGPALTETLKRMNIESKFENGLRVTDAETAKVATMVLAGKVNKSLVALIGSVGGLAVGLSGIDANMIHVRELDPALGYVGEITKVNTGLITDILNKGYIPVISSVACDKTGEIYNINADTMAGEIAAALGAEAFISLTDTPGILADKDDPKTLISKIHIDEINTMIADGTISGGMIPKVTGCADLVRGGVKRVFIIDGRVPHSILVEILTDEGLGTMVLA